MATKADLDSLISNINTEINGIASEITALQGQITGSMSATDVADVQTKLQAISDRLTGLLPPSPPAGS